MLQSVGSGLFTFLKYGIVTVILLTKLISSRNHRTAACSSYTCVPLHLSINLNEYLFTFMCIIVHFQIIFVARVQLSLYMYFV